jgi:glycosyltransferase involved in cell wall biosynthesis
VLTEHSSKVAERKIAARFEARARAAYAGAARLMAVSPFLAAAVEHYAGERAVEVLPNFIDTTFFRPPEAPRDSRGAFRFFALGLLCRNKGHALMVEAVALLKKRGREVSLDIGGYGPEARRLRGLIARLGVEREVRLLGRLSREEVRSALWQANAFVHASRVETFGIAVIEALATGLPVVVTRCGGVESIVTDELGLTVESGNAEVLAEAMEEMIGAAAAYDPDALHEDIDARFSGEAVGSKLVEIYRQTATGH